MKVLLIEDDQHTSELLAATLSAHRYAVDAITDGLAGLELATQWSYDLILLDVLIPKINGIEVCRQLRAQGCHTPVLMLTVKDSNEDIIAGLDAGADDYLAKSCATSQLLARVRALLRRSGPAASNPLLTWELLCLDPALARVTYSGEMVSLRPKEYSLLELFLRNPQRIFSRSTIIDHLWSMKEIPVEGAVTNLVKDLRHRLKTEGMVTDLIETVYGLGYRLKPAPVEDRRTRGRENAGQGESTASVPVLAADRGHDWEVREQRGTKAIQQIAERFRVKLEQRLAVLEAAARSLQAGDFSLQQREAARTEAHKLTGGLNTFGYANASGIAQAIEHLLKQTNQDTLSVDQLSKLLEELKQTLAQSLNNELILDSSITRN